MTPRQVTADGRVTTPEEGVATRRDGAVLTITLDRPAALNALDIPAIRRLREQLRAFDEDSDLRVAILTGGGERAFCTGADLKNTPRPSESAASGWYATDSLQIDRGFYVRALSLRDLQLRKPLIAAINGHALGGGLEIALACDLRIASENATFGLPEARWASIPGAGGISGLLEAIPRAVAMRMLLTGERIDAPTALRHGLVSDVVPAPDLLTKAHDLARLITGNGPLAIEAILQLARSAGEIPGEVSRRLEQISWGLLRDTADRAEGRAAFSAKREPSYRGQ